MNTPSSLSLDLDAEAIHVLIRALDVYAGEAYLRSQEARATGGRMHTVLNEGVPDGGLDAAKLMQLHHDAEAMIDGLLELIPDHEPITVVYEDGTPINRPAVIEFPSPAARR